MFKEKIEQIFPNGQFITFDEIQKGDTIVRGGANTYDEEFTHGVVIAPALFFHQNETYAAWDTDEDKFMAHQTAKTLDVINKTYYDPETGAKETYTLYNQWFYKLNIPNFESFTVQKWTELIVELLKKTITTETVLFDDVSAGDIVYTYVNFSKLNNVWVNEPLVSFGLLGKPEATHDYGIPLMLTETTVSGYYILVKEGSEEPDYIIERVKGKL